MPNQPLPYDVKRAIELLHSDLSRPWKVGDLAHMCDVPRRTLEKHFRRFLGCGPLSFLLGERLEHARRQLLRAAPNASVANIAADCGLNHPGRFSIAYRERYGESPSDTLKRRRVTSAMKPIPVRLASTAERPTLAISPFETIGPYTELANDIADEIGAALQRSGWIKRVPPPSGRYHLCGKVHSDGSGVLNVRVTLLDCATSRYVWADCLTYSINELSGSTEWLSNLVSGAIQSIVRAAGTAQESTKNAFALSSWDLSMRALPLVIAADPTTQGEALELLEQAHELTPKDPIPIALKAWCHGLRAGHHFTRQPTIERSKALDCARSTLELGLCDPLSEVMLSAALMLAHNLTAAEFHARRALAIDGGSPWAWGRLAWIHAYRGESRQAIDCSRTARVLGPSDPLRFNWSICIAAAHFELGHYNEAVRWYQRALVEQPTAIWINRFLAPAYIFANRKDEGARHLAALRQTFPDLTIAQVKSGLPHTDAFLDLVVEGLSCLGMAQS